LGERGRKLVFAAAFFCFSNDTVPGQSLSAHAEQHKRDDALG